MYMKKIWKEGEYYVVSPHHIINDTGLGTIVYEHNHYLYVKFMLQCNKLKQPLLISGHTFFFIGLYTSCTNIHDVQAALIPDFMYIQRLRHKTKSRPLWRL